MSASPPPPARVAVTFPGDPRDPTAWSGLPRAVLASLASLDIEVVPVSVAPPRAVDRLARGVLAAARLHRARTSSGSRSLRVARAMARAGPELARLYSATAARRLPRAGRLDGIVQIWGGYALPPTRARIVTFGDLTLPQALELGYPEFRALPKRALQARIDLQRRCFERAHACCMTTRWAARSLIDDYGIPEAKAHAVGVGRNHDVPFALREWTPPRFLFIGTNWIAKNGEAVLAAFSRLRQERPEARLDLVGDHPDIELAGVTGHGRLRLDRRDDRARMLQLFQRATCFVMPSRYEASAIAYVEALGAGLPCIGTTVGGSGELIGPAGRLVDPADRDGLLVAMRELCDPATAERLGRAALERAPLFTWRVVAERLLRALSLPGIPAAPLAEFL